MKEQDLVILFKKLTLKGHELSVRKLAEELPGLMPEEPAMAEELASAMAEAFAEELRSRFAGIAVVLWDERLSTVAAERVLIDADLQRKKRRKVIDMMAAVVILQNYLDGKNLRRKLSQ